MNAHACRISTPRQGDIDIRYGVGVDCLFVTGRLAMPLGDKQEHHPTLFLYNNIRSIRGWRRHKKTKIKNF